MEHCGCSRPDLWNTGDSCRCIGCGLEVARDTKLPRKFKAQEAEIVANDCKRAAPPLSLRTPFNYKRLEHTSTFRLLRLLPGRQDDEIACEVFHADISDPPGYEAVSYTWGSTSLTQELHTTEGLIKITENCFSALKGLRDVTWERILWVDAVCIAQENNAEKNHQIPLMARIFSEAAQVLIYLGDQTAVKAADDLFALLRGSRERSSNERTEDILELSRWPQDRSPDDHYKPNERTEDILGLLRWSWDKSSDDHCNPNERTEDILELFRWPQDRSSDDHYKPDERTENILFHKSRDKQPDGGYKLNMTKFLSLPWFSRIWVLQEVAMARHAKVIVGSTTLDWSRLSIANIHAFGLEATDLIGQVPAVLQISRSDRKPLKDLLSLITMARSCQSTDPRDRIYALLGLVHERSGIDLSPDYTRTTQDLYTDVAVQFLRAYSNLDFLSEIGNYEKCTQVDVDLSMFMYVRQNLRHIHHIIDLKDELQKITSTLEESSERMNGYWSDRLIEIRLSMGLDLKSLLFDFIILVKTKKVDLAYATEVQAATPLEQQTSLDLLVDIAREAEELRSQRFDRYWICKAKEMCESWKNRLRSAQVKLLQIETAMLQGSGTFLNPQYLFELVPTEQQGLDIVDEHLDLPSWVPDYRYHPRLFSFTRWRPNLFTGNLVARFEAYSQNNPTPSLEVKAIFVNQVQGTDYQPEHHMRLCDKNIPFLWDWESKSTSFTREFGQSLIELEHGATLDDVRKFSQGRRLALTETSLAIVPASFKLGDIIAVLYGGTVPYLLRQSNSSPARFQVIGECYLHGIKGPQFAPNYAELLGYFKDHVKPGAEECELRDVTDFVLRDGKGNENVGESSPEPRKIHIESTESKDHATPVMEKDTLPWKTIYLV